MKRSNLVLTIATCLLVAAMVFQSCKKDDNYTTNCNDLDYTGCIECELTISADSVETTTLCRSDYNSEADFKNETCAGFTLANTFGYDARCRNRD